MKKLTVALLSGGISSERDVSLGSGNQVFEALNKDKYDVVRYDPKTDIPKLVNDAPGIDVALIILHGPYGEDGTVQGLLDLLDIPYQGSGVLGSAVAMNKLTSKQLYEKAGLDTPPYMVLENNGPLDVTACVDTLGLPMVVKPVSGGSSIGIEIVRTEEALAGAVEKAFAEDASVLLEACIEGLELTCGVIGNEELTPLPVIEIIPGEDHAFFNYTAKYTAGEASEICPARIDDDLAQRVQAHAASAHFALNCKGYSRTDMIHADDKLYILETNTIPGMTPNSLLPLAARTADIPFDTLLDRLIELGIEEHGKKVR